MKRIIKKISKIEVKSFKDKLINIINTHLYTKDTRVEKKGNNILIEHDTTIIKITLKAKVVTYEIITPDLYECKNFFRCTDGYYVSTTQKKGSVYDLGDRFSKNFKTIETFSFYDKNKSEQFRKEIEKVENYYEDKTTGKRTLHFPCVFENYKEVCYKTRIDGNYILKRIIKTYEYSEEDFENSGIKKEDKDICYLRLDVANSDTKDIPYGGNYYGFDKELYFNYFQKEATVNDILENVKQKKYHINHDTYI